jgi:hypothetical protein
MNSNAGINVCHQNTGDGLLIVVLYVDDITINPTPLPAGADKHLIKIILHKQHRPISNIIKASSAAFCVCKSALGQTLPLLYHDWHNMRQIPYHNIYALQLMSCPILLELWTYARATIGAERAGLHGYSDSSLGDQTDDCHFKHMQ